MIDPKLLEDLEEPEEGAPAWFVSFSDLSTQLFAFFVLMLSFASMDLDKLRAALGSVQTALGGTALSINDPAHRANAPLRRPSAPARRGDPAAVVRRFVRARGLDGQVEVVATPRGIVLRMKDVVLFDVGSDRLRPEGTPVLDMIADLFARFTGELGIEGHTDDRPIASRRFPSNWELSTARATAALRYLASVRGVDVQRVHVGGYAWMQPVESNATADGRARNRRVEFLFQHEVDDATAEQFDLH